MWTRFTRFGLASSLSLALTGGAAVVHAQDQGAGSAAQGAAQDSQNAAQNAQGAAQDSQNAAQNAKNAAQNTGEDTKNAAQNTGQEAKGTAKATSQATEDSMITTKIKAKLLAVTPGGQTSDVRVSTKAGAVTLTGTVTSEAERQRALDAANSTDGVEKVNDLIRVQPTQNKPTEGQPTQNQPTEGQPAQ
jgi:osmotically-inducible protein OsmY